MPRRLGSVPWFRLPAQILLAFVLLLSLALPAFSLDVPMDVKRKWLEEAIQETLIESYPDPKALEQTLERLRGMGAGSWLNGTAGKGSDIDFTLGHPDPKVEKELARKVQAKVDRRYQAALEGAAKQKGLQTLPRPGSHEVKVINSRVQGWDELFSGPTGQRFILDYANKTGGGNACFKWKAVKDASGKVVGLSVLQEPTENFFRVTQGKVPSQLTNPSAFVDESLSMLNKAGKGTVQARAQAAAKYLNNTQRWLVPGLEEQWGARLGELKVPPEEQKLAEFLLNIKKKPSAEQMELLKIHFNVKSDEEVGKKLAKFADTVEMRLSKMSGDVKYLDELSRTGRLERLGGAERALNLKKALTEAFSTRTGRVLLAWDVVNIINAYQEGGPGAAALETAATAVSMAVPPAAIAALVADVARQVFAATAGWAINAVIFDPINDMAIKKFYEPGSSCYLFRNGPVPFISPFRGLTRETIAYKYSSQEMIRSAVSRFLSETKGVGCGWNTTAGWGDISGRLYGMLYYDFKESQGIAAIVQDISLKSRAGIYIPPLNPFRVLINGRPLTLSPAGQAVKAERFVEKVPPEASAEFDIQIAREYGMWQGLDPKAESLYDVWGKRGGFAAMRLYAKEHTVELINTGSALSLMDTSFSQAKGWSLEGLETGRRDFYMSNSDRQKWRYLNRSVKLTPAKDAAGKAEVRVKLKLVSDTPDLPPLHGEFVLAAQVGQPEEAKPPAGPKVELSCADPLRAMDGKVLIKAAVVGGKGPFVLHIRIKSPDGSVFKETKTAMQGRTVNISWKSRVTKPGVYEFFAKADDQAGPSSPWSEPLAILVEEEEKPARAPAPAPPPAPRPASRPQAKKGPCNYEVINTFSGASPQTQTGFANDKAWPVAASHIVQLPGPGTLRITMGVSGKHEYANHEYGACRWRSRAKLSSPPEVGLKGWVAGGTYYPGVRDYGENSYSWK
ncbi:MAG: hypothetical protein ABIK12_11815, partial [Pseudomonadota bacterium]